MNKNITTAQQHALQYWFVDGLAELSAGIVCILLAILFLKWQAIIKTRWSLLIFFFIALAFSFGLRLVIQKIKERTTYLRTGYVAPLSGLENKRAVIIAIAFTILLLAVNIYISRQGPKAMLWSSGAAGLIFAFLFSWTGYLTALRRFYYLALFSFLAGVLLAFLDIGYLIGTAILTSLNGLILLFSGFRARWAYTHQNSQVSG